MTVQIESGWGKRVLALRASRRMTQEQLAELIGVNRRAVIRWEKNGEEPSRLNRAVLEALERGDK